MLVISSEPVMFFGEKEVKGPKYGSSSINMLGNTKIPYKKFDLHQKNLNW